MSEKQQSIIIGGLSGGVLASLLSLPQNILGCLACLCYVGCGLVAVWHYTKSNSLTIAGGEGAGMGALAGIVCGVVVLLMSFLFRALNLIPGIEETIEQLEESGLEPEQLDMFIGFIEFMYGAGGIIVTIIIAVILGVVGGAIGAAVFKKGGETPGAEADVI